MSENKNQVQKQEVKQALSTIVEKDIADSIFKRVNQMEETQQLLFPPNYAVGNALKSAYLIIKNTKSGKESGYKPALEVCTKDSVATALLDMAIQGLNPVKKQCYFIVYGNQLQMTPSYFGHQKVVKTAIPTVEDIYAVEIFEGDEVEIEIQDGKKIVKSHKTKFENRDKPLKGVYSVIINNGKIDYEVMTWKEIQAAWANAKTDKVQKAFPQEMAKRTVLNRHCKRYMNTSDDSTIMSIVESYNRTIDNEYNNDDEPSNQLELQKEVDNKANQEDLVIEGETIDEQQPVNLPPEEHTPAEQPDQPKKNGPGF